MNFLIVSNLRDGKGLARDAEILTDLFVSWGHAVYVLDFRADGAPARVDVAIHLEHVEPRHLEHAPRNWYIPNAEWHMEGAREAMAAGRFERVLCKTPQAHRLFAPMTDAAVFVGFESRDRMRADVARERCFLYAPGQSGFRGTEPVSRALEHGLPATVVWAKGMAEPEFQHEQNRCAFHLCPAEMEGWGHWIHEALSVGAIVVTTDAAPMNEIEGIALRMPVDKLESFRLVERATVNRKAIEAAIHWCMALDDAERARLSAAARAAFEAERADFRERLFGLVGMAEAA